MRIRQLVFAAFVALSVAAPVQAADNLAYFGFKAGLMDADASGHANPLNVGALFGYQFFDEPHGSGAVEGEFTTTLTKGDKDGGGKWGVDTLAVYFAYRTAGDVYFKGKAGVANQHISGTDRVPDGSTFAFGVGVGWKASRKAGIELEGTAFDDLKFLSFGFYSFF